MTPPRSPTDPRPPGNLRDKIGGRPALLERLNRDFMPLASECIEQAQERMPQLAGMLAIGLETLADEQLGAVVDAADPAPGNRIMDPLLLECIRESAFSLSLPPPPGSGREKFEIADADRARLRRRRAAVTVRRADPGALLVALPEPCRHPGRLPLRGVRLERRGDGPRAGLRRHIAADMRSIGDFACAVDERLLCKQCRPAPAPGETDLRHLEGKRAIWVIASRSRTVRRQVRRVIWLASSDLQDLESTLLGRRDARYLGPKPVQKGDSRAVEPGLQAWWRQLRTEQLDASQPDLGRELGMAPRFLEFGKLGKVPVARPLHLLNPTARAAVFQITAGS